MSVNGRHPDVPLRSAVVVISHNYGRFLAECLESVLVQTARASEIVVVDDASTDDTQEIALRFSGRGVRYLRVGDRNVHRARQAGFGATTADVICFLDADDMLPPDYLAQGLKVFSQRDIGVVYSDVELFGESTGRSNYPAQFERARLERDNFIHAGSLVRREALRLSRAFEHSIDPLLTQGDWFLWRQVLRDGWIAAKQPALYRYRQHGANWTGLMKLATREYFDYAGLAHETISLFIPLSGRASLWPELAEYLARQTWLRGQTRLILMDTSQDRIFSAMVRNWAAGCDYPDVRHIRFAAARPGLADDNRRDQAIRDAVRVAVARIYNRMAREVATDYVWVVEDDILPPDDACERLLRGFDKDTVSVSGLYLSRYDGLPCAWDRKGSNFPAPGEGLEVVSGTGFGCVLLRGGILQSSVFQATGDYDCVFHQQMQSAGLKAKIDWRVVCQHRALSQFSI
jgi:glycosyltransferase involved in cell wall biosynthesis